MLYPRSLNFQTTVKKKLFHKIPFELKTNPPRYDPYDPVALAFRDKYDMNEYKFRGPLTWGVPPHGISE